MMKKEKKKAIKLCIQADKDKLSSSHQIKGIDNAYFPYKPYPEQCKFIREVHKAIRLNSHALIESPTGTGKTLCLLVGALSGLMKTGEDNGRQKVFYLTRTHSQISQIITELQKTVYDCKLNVLASRQNLCVNHNLAEVKGKTLDRACAEFCLQKQCPYREFDSGMGKIPRPMVTNNFKEHCKKEMICPFYYSRQITDRCEITVMPFNYLMDWNLLEKSQFELADSVLIFDEAHNIDSVAEQGSTIELTNDLLWQTCAELKSLFKIIKKQFLHERFANEGTTNKQIKDLQSQLEHMLAFLKSQSDCRLLNRHDLLVWLEQFTAVQGQADLSGLDLGNYREFIARVKRIMKQFYKREIPCDNLQLLVNMLDKTFTVCSDPTEFKKYTASVASFEKSRFLRLRCLDPAVSFDRLLKQQPKCIILSSGTLGSLSDWEKSLGYRVQLQLTIGSFIQSEQLYSRIVSKNESGGYYEFSYQKKHFQRQYEQLVRMLAALEKVVRNGIVVAFSNYELMEKTLKHTAVLSKKVFFESKAADMQQTFAEYSKQAEEHGAFMFIIIKGRFSEGVNFAGCLCRCLLVVGIPYLPMKDSRIQEKMGFIAENQSKKASEEWYINQTFKSLNQTLGRVIRSKSDYGAVLLVDQRYEKEEVQRQLPKWFTACLRPKAEGSLLSQLEDFFAGESWKNCRAGNLKAGEEDAGEYLVEESSLVQTKEKTAFGSGSCGLAQELLTINKKENKNWNKNKKNTAPKGSKLAADQTVLSFLPILPQFSSESQPDSSKQATIATTAISTVPTKPNYYDLSDNLMQFFAEATDSDNCLEQYPSQTVTAETSKLRAIKKMSEWLDF